MWILLPNFIIFCISKKENFKNGVVVWLISAVSLPLIINYCRYPNSKSYYLNSSFPLFPSFTSLLLWISSFFSIFKVIKRSNYDLLIKIVIDLTAMHSFNSIRFDSTFSLVFSLSLELHSLQYPQQVQYFQWGIERIMLKVFCFLLLTQNF